MSMSDVERQQAVSSIQGDRTDEEKTIREEMSEKSPVSKAASETESVEIKPIIDEDEFPDGGLRAWLVVLGSALGTFATFGFVNSWGVFQAYYEQTILSDISPSTIAWIGSVQYALVFIPGLVVGRLFDMGIVRIPMACASAFLVAATFLVAECKEYYQFILCQGLAVGVSCGIIFNPTISVVAHWFKRRKGLALGLVATGSSFGGTLFPIAARRLINEVGFKWTMRIIGFILLVLLVITNITLERRLPPRKDSGPFINLRSFKSPAYSTYCAAGFVSFLGLYTVLTYIDASAHFIGIPDDFSFYLVSIANAGSAVGRLSAGILTDKFGALNIMIPSTLLAGALTYAWPFLTTKGGFIGVGLVYGVASGVFVSMLAAPIISMGETHDAGLRLGMYFTVLALGALAGPPISGAINQHTGGYKVVGYYAGSMVVLSVVLLIVVRQLLIRRLRGKI